MENKDIYICIKCDKYYKTLKYYENHEKNCNGLNSLTCPKCMKSFTFNSNKIKHIKKNRCKPKSIIHLNNIINNYGSERLDYIIDDIYKVINNKD